MADAPLFFLHIPRTGGTSLIEYLDHKMAGTRICPAHEMFEFEQLERRGELRGFDFYRGHFGINLPDMVATSTSLITLLRSPIPRIFSIWRHLRNARPPFAADVSGLTRVAHRNHEAACNLGFRDFCELIAEEQRSIFNQMTVWLGSGRGWRIAAADEPKLDQSLLDRAKCTLDRFSFIGFTETFDDSIELLQRQFGWEVEPLAHQNAAPPWVFPKDNQFLEWLLRAAEFDVELYNYARERADRFSANFTAVARKMRAS